ncbi:hypothetical protein SSX86_020865 [Deinandra increscens subsp. villosa]|uniref:Uncharacterized protein n=1 Tax=Deinandra increscens subsp. villosa TaxID=3103831 RepID=A0AAP0CNN9_9ASTR
MKMRNKGKVYPSSSSSPPVPSTAAAGDYLSVLNLLPAAILTLAVVLSVEDREVLAYMLTRSIKSTNPPSSSSSGNNKNKTPAQVPVPVPVPVHRPPVFDCDCFDCYTSYWFKWDTSVNRELIHQAIEAFEENLSNNEQSKKKGKKKEKTSHRRLAGKNLALNLTLAPPPEAAEAYDVALVEAKGEECACAAEEEVEEEEESPEMTVAVRGVTAASHKGLARKVLPDVIGLFNWRLWSLWSPNV